MKFEYTKNEILLQVQNVSLNFGEKTVLNNVNFTIQNIVRPNMNQGQVISIVGKSGCGKSQLLRIISGLNKPSKGSVIANINGEVREAEIGYMGLVPQHYYTFEWRKVKKILEISAKQNTLLSKNEINDLIAHYVIEFNLADHLDKYPMELSGGQRQRVSIIQQLLNGKKFLAMDEPFSGLDSPMIDKTTELINKVATSDEHQTIFIVSHDLSNSLAISDTVILLSNKDGNGSTVTNEYDLMSMGLAWRKDIKRDVVFQDLLSEIKNNL